ncbi:hypothetical protein PUNSTDRAFT_94903 [Punctularia strigosozonata HHB-11173 SS5]|uniref:uncharacterized protein n=1 Tax=Punctularia strigosozonata (strain HHB-11173) TaxID=741275 RepID=UPI0004416AFA|nr:uncharacterized protein PUNSTDRAFT_94903 [Punctularia strigosozonata HHB-11173 SS5]EIN13674.1 hypothetical protein PUNSTDRAFT_94903 [Punctularia strigosozonata HHB-11173 SS5]
MADRAELIRNAVTFLADPKTQVSPLAQRIQFLEAKGLTSAEIEEALRQASVNATAVPPRYTVYGPAYGPSPYPLVPPAAQPWDWRDYFIGAVVSGSLVYGAVALARKYLVPHLRPPTQTAYEEDRDALTAQFDAAEALLREIQAETSAVKTAVETQKERVDKATQEVEEAVKEMHDNQARARDELHEIREEINNIRDMLPKMIDKNKESQTQSLAELQQELKSLKALLLSRGPSLPSTPSALPPLSGRPSIPAWQLAGASDSVPNVQSPSSSLPPAVADMKGKGVERLSAAVDDAVSP